MAMAAAVDEAISHGGQWSAAVLLLLPRPVDPENGKVEK